MITHGKYPNKTYLFLYETRHKYISYQEIHFTHYSFVDCMIDDRGFALSKHNSCSCHLERQLWDFDSQITFNIDSLS